jgi:hypothetical protein
VDHPHARRRDFGRGEGAGVVQHRQGLTSSRPAGLVYRPPPRQPVIGSARFTNVFVRRDGRRELVGARYNSPGIDVRRLTSSLHPTPAMSHSGGLKGHVLAGAGERGR